MVTIEKVARESSTKEIPYPAFSYADRHGEANIPQYEAGAYMESCEICGRKTPDGSLCPSCQEWVRRYDQIVPPNC